MPPKRMTMEEKRAKLIDIFQRQRTFYVIKEIEKISSKAGINEKTFKDVLQSLLDDNLVNSEKIGISNYYWSFALDEGRVAEEKLDQANKNNQNLKNKLLNLEKTFDDEKLDREDTEERTYLIDTFNKLNEYLKSQECELSKFAACDPRVYQKKLDEVKSLVDQINVVTENIFCMQTYVCNQFNLERKDFCENFKIDEEMDYVQ